MEHIFFEVQLCIKISNFKEKHVFDILINLCLLTGLHISQSQTYRVFLREAPW